MNYWATLKLFDNEKNGEIIHLTKSIFLLGRNEECDLKFQTNKLVSLKHCQIEQKEIDGEIQAWLVDLNSSNGCIINLKDKIKNNKHLLSDNDVIYLVHKKNDVQKNVSIQFNYKSKQTEENNDSIEPKNKKLKIEEEDDDTVEPKPICSSIKTNDYDENLTCTICSEIFHEAVSLQPCLHSFCAGCYSEWMDQSNECPICRVKVDRISKNHMLNNLIEAYLKNNPDKKRNQTEIEKLNEKNKITHDMLYPKDKKRLLKYKDDYEDESDDEENLKNKNVSPVGSLFNSDSEEEEDELHQQPYQAAGFAYKNAYAFNQPHRFTCRQCPQNKWLHAGQIAPDFTCSQQQNHILCQCCLEAMPDRNNEIIQNQLLPKQSCSMCFKAYCQLYWGCQNGGCKCCLSKFHEMKIKNDFLLNSIINENKYESELFSDWMIRNNKNIQNVFEECIDEMKMGHFKAGLSNPNDTLNKVVCRQCGYELFKELTYQYRINIPANQFYNHANQRPNCYYGKNCRTQKHNYEHCKKYNHVCEQTK